jgi:hypothetical protein
MFGGQQAPNLYYDWKFRTRKEPSEWGYNYEYSECGTSEPTPRDGHGTLWFVCNDDNPLQLVKTFLNKLSGEMGNTIKINVRGGNRLTVIQRATKETLCTGRMVTDGQDPNVGQYAIFQSRSMPGLAILYQIVANAVQNGRVAVVEHTKKEIEVAPDYKLVVVSGTAPGSDGDAGDDQGEPNEDGEYHDPGLSTRFTLFHRDEEVARCLMSYRDGSHDQSLGPTIECLSVKQSHRGKGLSKLLWYWVRCFIEENFQIECLNNDAPLGHIMIKTTQMSNTEIDTQVNEFGENYVAVSDHDFFYEYNRFQVRVPKGVGAMMGMMGGTRYPEEEGVLYIPLLSTEKLNGRNSGNPDPDAPMPGDATFTEQRGNRSCDKCRNVSSNHSKCSRCKDAFYCSRECQKSDWKRHKRWCGKSAQEVDQLLVEEGYKVQMPDGNWAYSPQGSPGGGGF